ncbi:MAG: Na(+)-translocating NADH-quinone reductase subunit A [Bacteroidetes bacterium]|nr:Na(+)-translocating NADH-quinone reductase subunit A [Bacteroidota bacterium]
MQKIISIKKGLNIPLEGEAEKISVSALLAESYALNPSDFYGLTPKLLVKEGDKVLAGTPLFYDKEQPKILFTAPVSGEVIEIKRGEKRKLLSVVILPDKENRHVEFRKGNPVQFTTDEIINQLLESGIWPVIRQRPYSVIADPGSPPKAIFISAFDTNPLAPDYDFIVHGHGEEFQVGIDALAKIVSGKVHLNIPHGSTPSKVFTKTTGAQINFFSGPHPAGNVGVQINHIDPINKGEKVWYLSAQHVLTIGRLFLEGRYNSSKLIALTGPSVKNRKYFKIFSGACIRNLPELDRSSFEVRFISGNALTGHTVTPGGWIGFYDDQLTLVPEGDRQEFMGWMMPGFDKFSFSKTFFSSLLPGKKYKLDTNTHGEDRPFVVTGQYEDVFPMDIYPQHLIKAILIKDLELMENLGIYEVDPEDFALCEFACTSKMNLQKIVREGLDYVRKECG